MTHVLHDKLDYAKSLVLSLDIVMSRCRTDITGKFTSIFAKMLRKFCQENCLNSRSNK